MNPETAYLDMTPRARRLLRWAFILTFLTVAPAIILSTAGYRYNFDRGRLERTGVLTVDTAPEGATIYVNDRRHGDPTPTRVQRLSPGRYRVRVEKAGFRDWTRTVEVQSRTSTFLDRIVLYREGIPEFQLAAGADQTRFSPDGRYLAMLTRRPSGTEMRLTDLRTGDVWLPYRTGRDGEAAFSMAWSPDGRRLLIERTRPVYAALVWDPADPETVTDLAEVADGPVTEAFWKQDAETLYAVADGTLHEIDLALPAAFAAGPATTHGFVVGGDYFGLIPTADGFDLAKRGLRDVGFETKARLPYGEYRRLPGTGPMIGWVSEQGDDLILIDTSDLDDAASIFRGRGRDGAWSPDGRTLLYWNDLELRSYDRDARADRLLTRIGTPIRAAAWYPERGASIYATGSGAVAIDEPDGFGMTATPLASFTSLQDLAVARDGATAWFVGTIGKRAGVWRLRLR